MEIHIITFSNITALLVIIIYGDLTRRLPNAFASYWIQDCGVAAENILLRVTDLRLGAVWCGLHPQKVTEDKVRNILKINEDEVPLCLLWIGYPDEEIISRDQYEEDRIVYSE